MGSHLWEGFAQDAVIPGRAEGVNPESRVKRSE
jgi:hypothetical protein